MGLAARPEFTGRIDLGHILQAVVLLITVAGGILSTYFALESRMSAQSERITALQAQLLELTKAEAQSSADNKQFVRDVSANLIKLGDQLVDLRILVAGQGPASGPRPSVR